jgi:YegS/Rv2252/BmrU family lipid kinase
MSARIVAIVNPRSNLGATGRQLDTLRRDLDRALSGASYALVLTEAPGHGSYLARKAIAEGAVHLIACGGDGAISEVVEGIMTSGASERVVLSVLARGTGSDFMRSVRRHAPGRAGRASLGHESTPVDPGELRLDVGRAEFTCENGERGTRHVLNVASMGTSAESVRWVDAQGRLGKRNRFTYLQSAFVGLARFRSSEVELRVDGALLYKGPLQTAVVANGGFFGGGMPVAPDACLDDGLFDVVCVARLKPLQALLFFASFLRGKHTRHPLTKVARAREVTLSSDEEVWLEIDGEPVGKLPARFELLPARLRLRAL